MADPSWTVELDLDAPPPARSRPPRRSAIVAVVAALVLAALTGPGSVRGSMSLAWRLDTSTRYFRLADGTAYTIEARAGVALVAHDLRSGSTLWSLDLSGPLADAYRPHNAVMQTRFPPFLGQGVRTTVFWEGGGLAATPFPTAALPLVHLAGDVAVVIDRDTRIPRANGYSYVDEAAGLPWTYRVSAIDLRTHAVRWQRTIPAGVRWSLPGVRPGATGITAPPSGQNWMVTDSSAGIVEVWDLATGTTTVRGDVGPTDPESYVMAVSGGIVVRHRNDAGPTLELLEPATLKRRWTVAPPLPDGEPMSCAPAFCLTSNGASVVVDPLTGAVIGWVTGTQIRPGPPGRLLTTGFDRPLTIVDLSDARLAPLRDWQPVDTTAYTGEAVVARSGALGRATIGLLDVSTAAVRELGEATRWSPGSRCQATADHLACGDGSTLRVWRY